MESSRSRCGPDSTPNPPTALRRGRGASRWSRSDRPAERLLGPRRPRCPRARSSSPPGSRSCEDDATGTARFDVDRRARANRSRRDTAHRADRRGHLRADPRWLTDGARTLPNPGGQGRGPHHRPCDHRVQAAVAQPVPVQLTGDPEVVPARRSDNMELHEPSAALGFLIGRQALPNFGKRRPVRQSTGLEQ